MGETAPSLILQTVVRSLNFSPERRGTLRSLSTDQWAELLTLTDEAHVSLFLADRYRDDMPETVRERLARCLARHAARHVRILEEHSRIDTAMRSRGVEFLVLKGLTHTGLRNSDSRYRPQYDIDLYCPPRVRRRSGRNRGVAGV